MCFGNTRRPHPGTGHLDFKCWEFRGQCSLRQQGGLAAQVEAGGGRGKHPLRRGDPEAERRGAAESRRRGCGAGDGRGEGGRKAGREERWELEVGGARRRGRGAERAGGPNATGGAGIWGWERTVSSRVDRRVEGRGVRMEDPNE